MRVKCPTPVSGGINMSSKLYKKWGGRVCIINKLWLVLHLIIISVSDTWEHTNNNAITTAQREEQFLFGDKEIATYQIEVSIWF